ncbi:MAG TPA: glycogen debranching N-terminal domain-containing protein [Gemmatimonadaceae bacterium]|nr:glycogen debranching N-terminal domain-containing protein [Gemmatimonadaceae bacterium]
MPNTSTRACIRPTERYAWHGQSLLIVDHHGECTETLQIAGYYFREARYLSTLRLLINNEQPWVCEDALVDPQQLCFAFAFPEISTYGGGGTGQSQDETPVDEHGIPQRAIDIRLAYRVGIASLDVEATITNRAPRQTVSFDLRWLVDADFADIQEALGGARQQEAAVTRRADGETLDFAYDHDELPYATSVRVSGAAWTAHDAGFDAAVTLAPQERVVVTLRVEPVDYLEPYDEATIGERERVWRTWRDNLVRIKVPANTIVEEIVRANVSDLASFALLQGGRDEWLAPQAGMPLYPALFGRDAFTAAWQAAFIDRGELADASLTRLGRLQSTRIDDWHDEEPGRIPYQVRQGPLARLNINPYSAYYADYASPMMFVIALAHAFAWSGDEQFLARHWDVARRIMDWARERGDRDGDGYFEYQTKSREGTKNQGWKDSGNAVLYPDGTPVPSPLGTCELQGYWFGAQQLMAALAWARGARDDAKAYWHSAQDLKARFNRDWWMPEHDFFALARDPSKALVPALTSNVGQCIATGIIDDEHLPRVVGRMFAPDLFSGWGVRTLSATDRSYNPVDYHLGAVWAVENATIVFGLRRFGFDERASELSKGLFDLATLYGGFRIPETVGGYARSEYPTPGAYPRANTPQLWNASTFPMLLQSLLGLQPVAPLSMMVIDPVLPEWMPEVILERVRIGGATATLRFWRTEKGESHGEIVQKRGTLHLIRQPPLESLSAGVRDRFRALIDTILP